MLRRALATLVAAACVPGFAAAQDPSFRVVNNTAKVVNEIYASPVTATGWGHDRLGSAVVLPGGSHIVRLPADGQCRYDVRIVYQGGTADELRNHDTCRITDLVLGGAAARPAAAPGGNPSFNLINRSGQVIEQFFASPTSAAEWGADRLGQNVVRPNQRLPIRLPQGECQYDLRIVFAGNTAREERRVDACALTDYVVR